MPTSTRFVRSAVAYGAVMAATFAGLAVAAPGAAAAHGHPAGLIGNPLTLGKFVAFSGYDVAADAAGTAYVGWISTTTTNPTRQVHLCRLPSGATKCTGGIQTIDTPDPSSAAGLQVVVTGTNLVHLIWFHSSLGGGAIAEATAKDGKNLTAAHDVVTDAPGNGALLAAVAGPHGSIWTVTYAGVPVQSVDVRDGLSAAAVAVHTPYDVGYAQLAFAHGVPVLAVEKYGSVGPGPHYMTRSGGGSWSSPHAVARTWAIATDAALATSGHGLRIVTGIDNASYRAVIAKWTGHGFSKRQLTADSNGGCTPTSHDGTSDPSGRLLDVSWECDEITVTNYPDGYHAGIARFPVSGTPTGQAQIASGTRGLATVVYSTENNNIQRLHVAHVRLPGSTHIGAHSGTGGRVTVTGPRSCLPPANVHVGWKHHAAPGWSFRFGALTLNGKHISGSTLDGAKLHAGKKYTLLGRAVFGSGSRRSTVQRSIVFRTCGNG